MRYRWARSFKSNMARFEMRRHCVPIADYLGAHTVTEFGRYESFRFIEPIKQDLKRTRWGSGFL